MKRIVFSVWIGSLVSALGCALVWAQATAQVSGTVRDQSGAVLPGVEITVTQTATGINRMTITNETGYYVLPNLLLGPYRLEAALPGFRTFAQTGIVLQVNSNPTINVVLEVGQVAETIEVQANAGLVETRSSTLGSVIENERILELPLNGRNVTDLIVLAGGAVRTGGEAGRLSVGESPMLAIGGGAGFAVDYTLDGADHRNFQTGTPMVMPFPDATQEFKVENSGTGAQRGNGAAVSAVTKSGTNEFHGDAFWFVRNDLFNARNFFAAAGSTLKRHQFGGTAGGPIAQNRLFFFAGYQGATIRQDPGDVRAFIPTQAILEGDWTAFASPACNNGRQIRLGAPFVNNRIDPKLYSPVALFIVNWKGNLPFPRTDDPCGEITYGNKQGENGGQYVGRVDFQPSANHSLFGRVLLTTRDTTKPEPKMFLQDTGWNTGIGHSYTFGSTYLVNPNTVHAFRLSVNRNGYFSKNVKPGDLFNWCDAGVKVYCEPLVTRIVGTTITGGFSINSGFLEGHKYYGNSYTVNDDLSLIRGAHQIALGLSASHGRMNTLAIFSSPHRVRFTGRETGLGLADFMLGRPADFFTGRSNAHRSKATKVAVFAGDTWQATSKLTLNYGLRWEPYLPEWVNAMYDFDYDRFRQGIYSSVRANAPAGWYFRGDPGFPENGINKQWLLFAPRMGLAWDVSGDGRTSVRASYALGYVFLPGDWRERYAGTGPWGGRLTLTDLRGGIQDPYLGVLGGDIFPYDENDPNVPFVPRGWVYSTSYDIPSPYSQSWTLNIQRQIGTDWIASASYVGSNIIHVRGSYGINNAIYLPGNADANGNCFAQGYTFRTRPGATCSTTGNTDLRRRFDLERPADGAKMSFAVEADEGGVQVYNGMVLSLERRVTSGVSVQTNYTWSHCIGPYATLYGTLALWPYETYRDPTTRDRGNCDSDRRHIFNLTTLAETPQFSNPTLRTLATGWRLSGIYRYSAGEPLEIVAGTDRALTGVRDQFANQVRANPFGDKSAGPRARYLDPDAFAIPALGTTGNIGRNSIQGPPTWSFDLALSRVFRFQESQRLEFRAEAYNVTNTFRPRNPSENVSSNTFGVIRESYDPRILQFALKYIF